MNLTTLAQAIGAIASSASRLCDRLEAAGLLSRSIASDSRREITISLTAEGCRRLEAFDAVRHQDFSVVLAQMSPEARESLRVGLTAFAEAALLAYEPDVVPA